MSDFLAEKIDFGFRWGPVEVVRLTTHPTKGEKRNVWLRLKTEKEEIDIRVTPGGKITIC